jgi:16S rRNA (guanine966-N2)-methyltransferase
MLGELEGLSVLDLFAGTGALGIEALSRGAGHVVFVEQRAAAARALRENIEALAIESSEAQVRRADVLGALRTARRRKETYDLVLIDPPYDQALAWGPELSAVLPALLRPSARVVVESDRRAPLALDLAVDRRRSYGDTSITIHRNQ